MRSILLLALALWVVSESSGYGKQRILALWVAGESRGYGKQGNLLSDILGRTKELRMSISNVSDASVSALSAKGMMPSSNTDKVAGKKHPYKLLLGRDAFVLLLHGKELGRHAVRMLSDRVSPSESEGHISQLDAVPGNPVDTQENAVRRQGVDSSLLRYTGLTLSALNLQLGVRYNVNLPPTLQGIQAEATVLAPATFKQAGLNFYEFNVPTNASFEPTSEFLVLVYRNISNFTVYTLPSQYQFGGPIVGIISSASNSTSLNPSVSASISLSPQTSINISLPMFAADSISNALCAFFASNGSIFVSNLASLPNICLFSTLGDFALVVQASSTLSPTQNSPPPVATSTNVNGPPSSSTISRGSKNWKLIVGATALTLAGLAFLVALALVSIKLADRCKLFFTSRFTENEEALQSSLIGNSKAPTAAVMRTRPALEIDMVQFTD